MISGLTFSFSATDSVRIALIEEMRTPAASPYWLEKSKVTLVLWGIVIAAPSSLPFASKSCAVMGLVEASSPAKPRTVIERTGRSSPK